MTAPTDVYSPSEFNGKVALVTGGSDGLGKHLVQTLVRLGATAYFCARRAEPAEALVKELGPSAKFLQADLADVQQARAMVDQIARQAGKLDYLVNNAAIDPRIEFASATDADFDRLINVNLRPFFTVTHAALPLLKAGSGKAIVNTITTNYMLGLSPFTLYNASKSGIVGLTRSLARELGPLGIRVNAMSPGWIMTDKQLREHVSEKDKQDLLEVQCLKELLNESHVTPATLFLLSSAARGITGQNLVVDAGKVMQ